MRDAPPPRCCASPEVADLTARQGRRAPFPATVVPGRATAQVTRSSSFLPPLLLLVQPRANVGADQLRPRAGQQAAGRLHPGVGVARVADARSAGPARRVRSPRSPSAAGSRHEDDAPRPGKVTRLVLVGGDRRAGADEVAVAVGAVDAADRRPVLGRAPASRSRVRGLARACTGASHLSRGEHRPRCAARSRSGLSSAGHSPAATRSISARIAIIASTEPVDLAEVLGLGRLDHQRARRPGTTSSARGSRSRSAAWRRRRR